MENNSPAGFLQAIRENPDDNAPRVIYADWLEEQGDANRANFIRLQCGLACMPRGDPRRAAYRKSINTLLHDHREEWLDPLHGLKGFRDDRVTFDRGLPSIFIHRIEDLTYITSLKDTFPLHEVRFVPATLAPFGHQGAQALAQSPHLENVTYINLTEHAIGDDGLRALAQSPHIRHVTHLRLGSNAITDAGIRALAESPYLQQLTHLDLHTNYVSNEGARALLQSPHMQHLTHLNLGDRELAPHLRQAVKCRFAPWQAPGQGHRRY